MQRITRKKEDGDKKNYPDKETSKKRAGKSEDRGGSGGV